MMKSSQKMGAGAKQGAVMEKSKTREEDIASPKRAAPVRARTLRRIDRDDRVEASADIRTDQTFLRCGGPQPMKRKGRS